MLSNYLLRGKGAFLIAGYNTMSAEEKTNYDERALCIQTGKMMSWITVSIALLIVAAYSGNNVFRYIGYFVMVLSIILGIVSMNRVEPEKNNILFAGFMIQLTQVTTYKRRGEQL